VTRKSRKQPRTQRHGNIFSPDSGSMYVHVQRENGLAHHTMVLRPWQVQALRVLTSKWFLITLAVGLSSWGYFAVQSARVPMLQWRIKHLEEDAQRIDSLQKTLTQLQSRYEQVQRMLSAPAAPKKIPKINAAAAADSAHP
jgi:Tfp pilus assembly protein PilN